MPPQVLLVNPNRLRPPVAPLALDYLGDGLAAAGLEARLLDLCFETSPVASLCHALAETDPLLVGITVRNTDDCYCASADFFLPDIAGLIAEIRKRFPGPIVVGGAGYSVAPGPMLAVLGADYGIHGDGEVALPELSRALAAGDSLAGVPGLVWLEQGEIHVNPPWLGAVAELPARRRSLVDNLRYYREGGQGGLETKRGCDRACIYCADPLGKGRKVRVRTPAQVAEEFAVLCAQGVDCLHLCDSEFNVPPDHAAAVCEELVRRGLGERIRWYAYATPSGFTPELARLMRAAGCVGINFGVDSGDDRMLAALGRDFTSADLRETARACQEAGLVFMYDLLLGGPGETRESVGRTISLMKEISPDRVGVSLGVRIYPGTALAELVRREGPLERNPNLRGAVADNADFIAPVFYVSAALGDNPEEYVAHLVGGDQRFFFPTPQDGLEAYNYNNNQRLVEAIQQGYRGAYWDILRRLAG